MASISAMVDKAAVDAAKRAADKAAGKSSSKKPIFLFLKPGYKATIRPVFRLDDGLTLAVHNKWSENADYRVNAICAKENGQPCEHCDSAKVLGDKQLRSQTGIYLPVYVYSVFEGATQVNYKEKDDYDREVEKPVRGFRVLEMFLFGKTYGVLDVFRKYEAGMNRPISSCDWTYSQTGSGQSKTLTLMYNDPAAMSPALVNATPSIDRFRTAILEARPPVILVANALGNDQSFDVDPLTADVPAADEEDGIEDF
jgi:endonuclease YncB( thermonuclease family)